MAEIKRMDASEYRPGSFQKSGTLVLGAIGILLIGGAFGYFLRPDSSAVETVRAVQSNAAQWQGSIFYITFAAVAAVLLLALSGPPGGRFSRWLSRPGALALRPQKPVAEFVQEAEAIRIGLRVAREGYDLLQHYYPRPMCIDLRDSLRQDLKLTEENIAALRAELLGRADRQSMSDANVEKILTVRNLFEQVEQAPMEDIDRATMRLRITDLPFPARPVVENIEFTPSTPVADPDFLRRAHFNWLRRRDSDYKGFRSRATDDQTALHHAGPFRRANEQVRRDGAKAEGQHVAGKPDAVVVR